MDISPDIIDNVKQGTCILFLGAMASAPTPEGSRYVYRQGPPSGSELSQQIADNCKYPYEDRTNLQRVSLYYQFRKDGSREALVKCIAKEILEPHIEPSAALHMLAALPFRIVITTNFFL